MPSELQPYIGPRPFEREERQRFFGRERESSELLSRVIAHPAVLLYSQSGAGKTSLLNAGLIPLLENEGFEILPTARVRGLAPKEIPAAEIPNLYVFNVLMSWSGIAADSNLLAKMSIADFLNSEDRPLGREGMPAPRVAIFDQFEELFTFYPERWNDRQDFFEQVSEALERDRLMRIIFVMREDYIAELDPYVSVLPEKLRTRFRLERLREDAALEAVKEPLDGTGYSYDHGVPEQLVNNLLRVPVETAAGVSTVVGEFVEPVQLQVVCQTLWQKLDHSDHKVITLDQLKAFGDVDVALSDFYVTAISNVSRETIVNEGVLRRWFEHTLITPSGTRGTVFRGREETGGIPNVAVDRLVDQHLIRGEVRGGARWYELTHDRMIEPIIRSNQQWMLQRSGDEQTRQRLEKRAAEWVREGRPASGLLDEAELLEARRWLESPNANDVGYSEALFALVQASRAAVEEAAHERQRLLFAEQQRRAEAEHALFEDQQRRIEEQKKASRRLRRLAAALAVMFLLAIGTAGYAVNRSRVATSETQRAQQKEREANAALADAKREKERANEQTARANTEKEAADQQRTLAIKLKDEAEKAKQLEAAARKKVEENAKAATEVALLRAEAETRKAREKEEGRQRATELENSALRFQQSGNLATAIEEYLLAASQYEELEDFEKQAKTLETIGNLYRERKAFGEAEGAFKESLKLKEKLFGSRSQAVALGLNDLGILYADQNKYSEAESFYLRAIEIRKSASSSNDDDLGLAIMNRNLANLYDDQNKYVEADQRYQQALKIQERVLGADDPNLARTLVDRANALQDAGRYIDAEPFYTRALDIYKASAGTGQPSLLARNMQRLSWLYINLGRYSEAETLLTNARTIQESLLYQWPAPPNFRPSDLAVTFNDQALVYNYRGQYSEAERLYEKALEINLAAYGPKDREVATMKHNLALTYFNQGRYAKSEQYERESLAILDHIERPNPNGRALSYSVLARVYGAQARYSEAEAFGQLARDEMTKARGSEHPSTATILTIMASLDTEQLRFEQAESLMKRAIAIHGKAFGENHWRVASDLRALATIYRKQSKNVESERLYKQALPILENSLGRDDPDDPNVISTVIGLAKLYINQGKYFEAEPLLERAQKAREKSLGAEHPDIASILNDWGLLYFYQGKTAEAEAKFKAALAIREKFLGPEHPYIALTLENYSALLHKTNRETEAAAFEARARAIRAKYPQLGSDN